MKTRTESILLYVITGVTDCVLMLLIFTVSRALAETDASLLKMGIAGGGVSAAHVFSSFLFGRLSDRVGRRRIIYAGSGVLLCSVVGCLMLEADSWAFFPVYWLCGIGCGMIYPPLIAWLHQDEGKGHHKQASGINIRFCLSWNIGIIVALKSGGILYGHNTDWPLKLAVGLMFVSFFVLLLTGRRSTKPKAETVEEASDDVVLHRRTLSGGFMKMNWVANLGGAFAMSMILHLFPDLVVRLGISSNTQGTMLVTMRGFVIATYLLLYLSNFWHLRFIVSLVPQFTAVAGLIVLSFAKSPVWLVVGLVSVGALIGYNYFAGLYYSTTSRDDEGKGLASGMHEATIAAGFALGSIIGGIVGTYGGPRSPYLLGILVIVILAVIQIRIYFREVRPLLMGR